MSAKILTAAAIVSLGAVLAASPAGAQAVKPVYDFTGGANSGNPLGGVIKVGGALYGTTYNGGIHASGNLFRIDLKTGAETTLHTFTNGIDGGLPAAAPLALNGLFYGTTSSGGASGAGAVYVFDPKTAVLKTLYSFTGGADGSAPMAGLLDAGGMLYGTTNLAGAGNGTVFKIDPATGQLTTVYTFAYQPGMNGFGSMAPLIAVKGTLYGTTSNTVFKIDAATGKLAFLYTWNPDVGTDSPVLYNGGALYGTTFIGGQYGWGAVYKLDLKTRAYTTVYSFTGGTDGAYVAAPLTEFGGALYTVASSGTGVSGNGTVSRIDLKTGAEKTVWSFTGGQDGGHPQAGLIKAGGMLYGTAFDGGIAGNGTVFAVKP